MAALTRAGFAPAAAALLLLGSVTARAEATPPAEKTGTTTAAEQKPDTKAEASKAAESATGKSADKDAASAEKAPDAKAEASKADESATEKSADKAAASAEKAPDGKAEASKADESATEKSADKAAASAEKAPDAKSEASKADESATEKSADKDAASAEKAPDAKSEASKSVAPASDTTKADADSGKGATDTAKSDATDADTSKPDTSKPDTTKPDAAKADSAKLVPEPAVQVPRTTAALPDAVVPAPPSTGVVDQVLPPADAIIADVRQKLTDLRGLDEDAAAGLVAFYDELNGPAIWISTGGLTAKGKAVVAEIGKADDWGLPAADFQVPHLAGGNLSADAAADAEITLARAILKYARYARGGRINPASISQLLDQSPTLKAPKSVLTEIAAANAPDAYLRSLHPQHEQFERLRQALSKLRGTDEKEEEPAEDPALSVKIPPGRLIRGGMEDPQVALLRQRLKVPVDDAAKETVYDEELQEAVREFQRSKGLRPDALIGNNTRAVLNGQPKPVAATADSKIERILINMERWRWMPEDMGDFYVWDNVPEALTRIVKKGKIIHTDKIIVGQPSWPTPVFSADMKTIVFHPSWGVPDGIKRKELLPLLRKSSGAGFFGIFGGGYSSQAVLDAYELRAYYNGRQIDPNQVDWNSVNIAAYSFQQPPGPKNVLGIVKFMFPNKHDVYMHDTPERHLFVKSFRALSHGCMRVEDPRRLAEILLGEDKGWSPDKVRGMFGGYSAEVALDTHIPVHVTYITARVDDNGKLLTFADFYGLDGRTAAALTGRNVRFESPAYADDEIASGVDTPPLQQRRQARKKQYDGPPTLSDAITNLFSP
jgi:murein L,D-transpeptidase YcbB/YkuD